MADYQPTGWVEDGSYSALGSVFSTNNDNFIVGCLYDSFDTLAKTAEYKSFAKFSTIATGKNALIQSATLNLTKFADASYSPSPLNCIVRAYAHDSGVAPTGLASCSGQLQSLSTARAIASVGSNDASASINVKEVIQEIVMRPNWKYGNPIVLWVEISGAPATSNFGLHGNFWKGRSSLSSVNIPTLSITSTEYSGPLIRSTTSANSIQTGLTLNKPTGTASGDILVMGVCGVNNNVNFEPPAGFTQIGGTLVQSSNKRLMLAYKVAGTGEPASYSPNVSVGDSSDFDTATAGVLMAISGAKPVFIHSSGYSSSTVPVISNTGVNNLVIAFGGNQGSPSTLQTIPSGWVSVTGVVSAIAMAEDAAIQVAYKQFPSSGSISTHSWGGSFNELFTLSMQANEAAGGSSTTQYPILLF